MRAKIITGIHQGHEAWDEMRSVRPTASEFGRIFTGTGKISAQRESYMRKLAIQRKYKLPQWTGNAWTDRGHELEPEARQLFAELTGFDVREVAFLQDTQTIAGGSPDGLIYDGSGEPVSGLEIKAYKLDKHLGIIERNKVPPANLPQTHGLLWLSGFKCWQFVPYNPEAIPLDFKVIEVEPNDYTAELGAEVTRFCDELESRAEEFIADYEKRIKGKSVLEVMPVLSSMIHPEPEMVI